MVLQCGRFVLDLSRPAVMGVVNVTPDSFSERGLFATTAAAIDHALRLVEEGADILDIGGESTRPGAGAVSVAMELDRVMPVVDRLRDVGVPLSVDTRKPAVMRAAIAAGVDMVNDICALGADGAIAAVAPNKVAVCLMHMRGDPQTMQDRPEYDDVVGEIERYLEERTEAAIAGGIGPDRIVVDPGFGFGKRVEHNVALLAHLDRIVRHGRPVLAGLSRKSIIGAITGRPVGERVHGSIAAAMLALERGARILRVHDVAATRDAVSVWMAVSGR